MYFDKGLHNSNAHVYNYFNIISESCTKFFRFPDIQIKAVPVEANTIKTVHAKRKEYP